MLTFLSFGKNWKKIEREIFPAFPFSKGHNAREGAGKSMENARMRQNNNKAWCGWEWARWQEFSTSFVRASKRIMNDEKCLLWFDEFVTCSKIVFRVNWFVCCDEIIETSRLKPFWKEGGSEGDRIRNLLLRDDKKSTLTCVIDFDLNWVKHWTKNTWNKWNFWVSLWTEFWWLKWG